MSNIIKKYIPSIHKTIKSNNINLNIYRWNPEIFGSKPKMQNIELNWFLCFKNPLKQYA